MTVADEFMLALTGWRENDRGGQDGMQSVINSIMNRAKARGMSPYAVCVQPAQYDAITIPSDPGLLRWPAENNPQWVIAQSLSSDALQGVLPDITQGATSYYATSMEKPPWWAAKMIKTVEIEGQIFFR